MQKKGTIIAGIVLVVLCVAAGLLYMNFKPETTEGSKEITVKVVDVDGTEKEYVYKTDAEYLGEVLLENEMIEGESGEFGFFIKAVDGKAADDAKQQWWCITKNGEDVMTSVDTTPIQDQEQYELTLKEGYDF